MAWYRTGTISVTAASTAVTGAGTAWIANAAPGESLQAPDGRFYEIASINSDTSLTLASAYTGTTLSGQSYAILPSQSYIRDLAAQAAALINTYSSIASTAGAGRFADGTLAAPGISFVNDTDTGWFRSAANTMLGVAAGAAILAVSSTGLAVTGNLSNTGNTTLGDATTDTVTISGRACIGASPAGFARHTIGTTYTSDGSSTVGAGVYLSGVVTGAAGDTSYLAQLVALSSGIVTQGVGDTIGLVATVRMAEPIITVGAGDTVSVAATLALVNGPTEGAINANLYSNATSGTGKYNIYADGTASSYHAGNFGIGTSSPQRLLTLANDGSAHQIALYDNDLAASGAWWLVGNQQGSYKITQATNASGLLTSLVDRLIIDSSGNVGIGTSAPNYLLQLHRAAAASSVLQLTNTASGTTATDGFTASLTNSLNVDLWNYEAGWIRLGANNTAVLSGEKDKSLALQGATSQTGTGISFPATQSASSDANTLDDYREATATLTATGMTTSPTGTAAFVKTGNMVVMQIPAISGTSNTTAFTLTGVPTAFRPSTSRMFNFIGSDNGGASFFGRAVLDTGGVITLYTTAGSGAWTSSGTKQTASIYSVSYLI